MNRTQELAQRCIDEKWKHINICSDFEEWIVDCAFCEDAKERIDLMDDIDAYRRPICNQCLISDLPICRAIPLLSDYLDPSLIVEALEDLVNYGDLSERIEARLMEYV